MDMMQVEKASVNPEVEKWCKELDSARRRQKDWMKEADDLVDLYECEKAKENSFNIFYSNTETLAPALYNNLPRPAVKRRFDDKDPMGKVSSSVIQRTLEYLLDNDAEDYVSFDTLMEQSVLQALVPGRGVTWYKYDAYISEKEGENDEGEESYSEGEEEEDESPEAEPTARVESEIVCGELVPYNQFFMGYAKVWKNVPWVGREHFMAREELVKNFGEKLGNKIPLTIEPSTRSESSDEAGPQASKKLENAQGAKLAHVYEVWDKETRMVYFFCPAMMDSFIKKVEDPLELTGFFPLPEPLAFFPKISSMVPQTLYSAYKEQAKELNRVTQRIMKLVEALKIRGFYDSTLENLTDLLSSEDGTLLSAENVAALQNSTLDRSIWLFPIKDIIPVLQQLYLQREQIKRVIYEITGVSDILRGASVASETATAQNIKNQWGTLRLKKWQKRVQKYVRSCLRIMAEIACKKFSPETLAAMTNLPYPTAQQKEMAQMQMQQIQQALAQMQSVPADPNQPPPPQLQQLQQMAQQLQQILTKPSWAEISSMLQNDMLRNYRIDIETNSTVDLEATEDKQSIGEFMNALAQFLNGIGPLVQNGTMPFEAAKAMLMAIVRKYRFGVEVEQEIEAMMPPPKQPEDPTAGLEMQKAQMEMQALEQKTAVEKDLMVADMAYKKEDLEIRREELAMKREYNREVHMQRMTELRAKTMAQVMAPPPVTPGKRKGV